MQNPTNRSRAAHCFLAEALEQRALFTVLTFEPSSGTFANYSALSQNYGDRITAATQGGFKYGTAGGKTAKVVASYGGGGSTAATWATGYGDLKNVIFPNPNGTKFQMALTADSGYAVTLASFDMASYSNNFTVKSVSVLDGSGKTLYSKSNVKIWGINAPHHTHFAFAAPLTAGKLQIKFDSTNSGGYNVGIDNIQFGQIAQTKTTISGTVFNDTDGNGKRGSGEALLSGWRVYIDANNNGKYDSGETNVTTTSTGTYSFSFTTAGTYRVALQLKTGYTKTVPTAANYKVTVPGSSITGALFGVKHI